jgi:hypothetical protein
LYADENAVLSAIPCTDTENPLHRSLPNHRKKLRHSQPGSALPTIPDRLRSEPDVRPSDLRLSAFRDDDSLRHLHVPQQILPVRQRPAASDADRMLFVPANLLTLLPEFSACHLYVLPHIFRFLHPSYDPAPHWKIFSWSERLHHLLRPASAFTQNAHTASAETLHRYL